MLRVTSEVVCRPLRGSASAGSQRRLFVCRCPAATSAPGLGSPAATSSPGLGSPAATSAPGLGSPAAASPSGLCFLCMPLPPPCIYHRSTLHALAPRSCANAARRRSDAQVRAFDRAISAEGCREDRNEVCQGCHIGTGTGLAPVPSAPSPCQIWAGTGLALLPHLYRDWGSPRPHPACRHSPLHVCTAHTPARHLRNEAISPCLLTRPSGTAHVAA